MSPSAKWGGRTQSRMVRPGEEERRVRTARKNERKNEPVERERGLRKGAGCGGCRSGLSAVLVWILLRAVWSVPQHPERTQ